MTDRERDANKLHRREFFKAAGAGLTAAGVMMTAREQAIAQTLAENAKMERIAGCTWPVRTRFKTRQNPNRGGGAGGAGRAGGGAGAAAGAAGAAGAPAAGAGGRGGRGGGGGGAQPMAGPEGATQTMSAVQAP